MGSIPAMQAAARIIDQAGTGYNQVRRWSFFNRQTDTINKHQDGDCSSVCAAIIRLGGYPIDLGYPAHSGVWTGNFAAKAQAAGFTLHPFTGLQNLLVGDFVVRPDAHVEFVALPGTMFSAGLDENGNIAGGRPGDQTGHEVRYTPAYNYRGGWTQVLRPPTTPTQKEKGFLMALSDAEQKKLFARVQNIQDILTGYAPNTYVKKGFSLPRLIALVTDGVGVGAGTRSRTIQDLITGGGPAGGNKSLLREILANQEEILKNLVILETRIGTATSIAEQANFRVEGIEQRLDKIEG